MTSSVDTAGECHAAHQWMAGQGPAAGFSETCDQVEHPGRKPDLVNQFGELQHRSRSLLRGLDDDRVAGSQRRRGLCCRQEHLCIPRDDSGYDTNRLPGGEYMEVRLVDRQRVALDLVGQAGVVAVVLGDVGRLSTGLDGQLSAVLCLD